MKYTDYSIEALLDLNRKQETVCKKIKEEIIDDGEIMKYYQREKYPTSDQLEHISLQLDIKISTLKTWYRTKRQHERKTPSRALSPKATTCTSPPHQRTITPTQQRTVTPPHSRTTTPSQLGTITPPQSKTTTPPQQKTITPLVSPTVQSPPSYKDGSHHPYFQLISEKIGISPPKTDANVKTSPSISPSQQISPMLPYQRFQNQGLPGRHTVPPVLPLYHPFSQPYSQLYYGSPYLQYPVSTSSSLDNTQPLDLSKPVSLSSPENHSIKQSYSPPQPDSLSSPENHSIKQSNSPPQPASPFSPENNSIKQSNSPDRIKQHTSDTQCNIQYVPDLPVKTEISFVEYQPRSKTSPEPVKEATTKTRTVPTKTSRKRSTPSPKLSDPLSPPVKPNFGSGLRQLVIEGRSFSP